MTRLHRADRRRATATPAGSGPTGADRRAPDWQHGCMSLSTFRVACALVFAGGIVTMIVTSIVSNNMGVMVTAGLVTAAAALVLLAVSSATEGRPVGSITDDIAAERLERRIEALVSTGVDERALRDLVRDSIRLGRGAHG